mmetsp:Transcript_10954/g.27655  ORF Transcript_10954/g.27655 Transcript_10954/m.27655 type:complete len:291 (-) Transcript_10954:110-982(-)
MGDSRRRGRYRDGASCTGSSVRGAAARALLQAQRAAACLRAIHAPAHRARRGVAGARIERGAARTLREYPHLLGLLLRTRHARRARVGGGTLHHDKHLAHLRAQRRGARRRCAGPLEPSRRERAKEIPRHPRAPDLRDRELPGRFRRLLPPVAQAASSVILYARRGDRIHPEQPCGACGRLDASGGACRHGRGAAGRGWPLRVGLFLRVARERSEQRACCALLFKQGRGLGACTLVDHPGHVRGAPRRRPAALAEHARARRRQERSEQDGGCRVAWGFGRVASGGPSGGF